MLSTTVFDEEASFVYGEETRHAVVSYKGKTEYIGPFSDKQAAMDAAKVRCRSRGWTGESFI
ncbi:hypothetical protein [Pseudorhizobium marinum]|uniref:hypothetical protein n=1 Tax=Pseudorhizobium marinum TaxID=1496690 RepID=UPI0004968F19|nr:hypothetical protein [Pseudorhizobium marinum]